MADVLTKIHRLLALATSPNENEARSAAVAAAKLIREHAVQLKLPASEEPAPPVVPPTYVTAVTRPKGSKVKDLHNVEWTFYEEWGGGGSCAFCALPCYRGNAVYLSSFENAVLHVLCWTSRQTGKTKPGPAPPPRRESRGGRESSSSPDDARAQKAIDEFWDAFEKTRR